MPVFQVFYVDLANANKVGLKGSNERVGQHGCPVFEAFAFTNNNLVFFKVQVFDAQTEALHET